MTTAKDAAKDAATGYEEPKYDERVDPNEGGVTHVLAATSIRGLADLEGERQVAVPVHPNGQAIHQTDVPTVPDPAIAALDLKHAPLAKDAETTARGRKA